MCFREYSTYFSNTDDKQYIDDQRDYYNDEGRHEFFSVWLVTLRLVVNVYTFLNQFQYCAYYTQTS